MSFLINAAINAAYRAIAHYIPSVHHRCLMGFVSALGYKDLKDGMCFGIQRMGTQAVCCGEVDVFNNRVKRIFDLYLNNSGSHTEAITQVTRELSEGIGKKDVAKIQSAVDLLAFAEGIAVVQTTTNYNQLFDNQSTTHNERLQKAINLIDSQKIASLGGLETIGAAIDQYSPETFEKYICELKTIANSTPIDFLILELTAEHHAVTIIYSHKERCWYCIDANNLPIEKKLKDKDVSKWIFKAYKFDRIKKRRLISTYLKILGKDLQYNGAFDNWRKMQKANRLQNLTDKEINQKDDFDITPLNAVAKLELLPGESRAPIIEALLDRGAHVDNADKSHFTPLISVVLATDIEATKVLLSRGANPNHQNDSRNTALFPAARWNNIEIVNALLKAGADPNIKSNSGKTALFPAASWNNIEIVNALLKVGADPNIKSNSGETALFDAACRSNIEIVNALLKAGADPNIKSNSGETALFDAASQSNIEIVNALLKAGANPNIQSNDGETPVSVARKHGHVHIVKALLTGGSSTHIYRPPVIPNFIPTSLSNPVRPLHGQGIVTPIITDSGPGIEPHHPDKSSFKPPIDVVIREDIEGAKVLVSQSADPTIKNKSDEIPLSQPITGDTKTVNPLLKTGPLSLRETIAKVFKIAKAIFAQIGACIAAPFKFIARIIKSGFTKFIIINGKENKLNIFLKEN